MGGKYGLGGGEGADAALHIRHVQPDRDVVMVGGGQWPGWIPQGVRKPV